MKFRVSKTFTKQLETEAEMKCKQDIINIQIALVVDCLFVLHSLTVVLNFSLLFSYEKMNKNENE